ncbi:3'-5' exonuclease family protein [Mangrovimonas cancribranchiae]|uniref:Exonuclease domain-containing protein n=1 Tax=Mangrovimonas cancribranchiae TaxID=3080055 RepID=A0AAU6P318_9FLAO
MYAIVDIETTGGKYNEEGITEIAIYKFDGHEIVDQFISLVNPERDIQPFVVNLTGINNKMLRNAPKFYEVAKRIVEITEDCIIVAHNAKFDYRILKTEFKRLGFGYKRKTLCTVELSKQLIPGQNSYSLGKLARSLGIAVSDRHRASGDAQATVKLFKMLLHKDLEKFIIKDAIRVEPKSQIEPTLKRIINDLPNNTTGIYYIHNNDGDIIYIGKSKNIKNRISQHFTNTSPKSKKIQLQATTVTYEKTGSELIALLKESEEIKRNKPMFNRALRRNIFTHALYSFIDNDGYINLKLDKADNENAVTTFTTRQSGKQFLFKATEEFNLCQKLTGLYPTTSNCFNYTIKECEGACIKEESPEAYNKRVNQLISKYSYYTKNMLIIDRGRHAGEKSVVYIKNGIFVGLGHFDLNYQITNIEVLESIITPMENNRDSQHIIQNYLRKNKKLKIVSL